MMIIIIIIMATFSMWRKTDVHRVSRLFLKAGQQVEEEDQPAGGAVRRQLKDAADGSDEESVNRAGNHQKARGRLA